MKPILWISLCAAPFMAIAQEEQQTDSLKTTILNEIIIKGYKLENPTFSKISNNYDEKIVQPKKRGWPI